MPELRWILYGAFAVAFVLAWISVGQSHDRELVPPDAEEATR